MDQATQSTLINIVNNTIINFNQQVVINLFFYFAAATAGTLTASKVVSFILEWVAGWVRYKWSAHFDQRMTEIMELTVKTHDRLVEIATAISTGEPNKKALSAKIRLRYAAARLNKYNKSISPAVEELLNGLIFNKDNTVYSKNVEGSMKAIGSVREKLDKLWVGLS